MFLSLLSRPHFPRSLLHSVDLFLFGARSGFWPRSKPYLKCNPRSVLIAICALFLAPPPHSLLTCWILLLSDFFRASAFLGMPSLDAGVGVDLPSFCQIHFFLNQALTVEDFPLIEVSVVDMDVVLFSCPGFFAA